MLLKMYILNNKLQNSFQFLSFYLNTIKTSICSNFQLQHKLFSLQSHNICQIYQTHHQPPKKIFSAKQPKNFLGAILILEQQQNNPWKSAWLFCYENNHLKSAGANLLLFLLSCYWSEKSSCKLPWLFSLQRSSKTAPVNFQQLF